MKKQKKINSFKEPLAEYEKKTANFPFNTITPSTFEKLEEENRIYSLHLSPVQRLAYLKDLNINTFGRQSLLTKSLGTEITKK